MNKPNKYKDMVERYLNRNIKSQKALSDELHKRGIMSKRECEKLKKARYLIAIKLVEETQTDFDLNDDECDIGYFTGKISAFEEIIAIIDEIMMKE